MYIFIHTGIHFMNNIMMNIRAHINILYAAYCLLPASVALGRCIQLARWAPEPQWAPLAPPWGQWGLRNQDMRLPI